MKDCQLQKVKNFPIALANKPYLAEKIKKAKIILGTSKTKRTCLKLKGRKWNIFFKRNKVICQVN